MLSGAEFGQSNLLEFQRSKVIMKNYYDSLVQKTLNIFKGKMSNCYGAYTSEDRARQKYIFNSGNLL